MDGRNFAHGQSSAYGEHLQVMNSVYTTSTYSHSDYNYILSTYGLSW